MRANPLAMVADLLRRLGSWLLGLVVRLRRSEARKVIPKPLRRLGYRLLPQRRLRDRMTKAEYEEKITAVVPAPQSTDVKIGIITDPLRRHGNYEAACLELGVPYELVDISGADWMEQVQSAGCDAFVVWPSHITTVTKAMFDERLRVLAEDMGRMLFPSYGALWLYESKRRIRDWFVVHGVPHPETWVFFDAEKAMDFLAGTDYPLIFKTDLGSSASGVEVVRTKGEAARIVEKCFGNGYLAHRHDCRDRQWGQALFQKYVRNAREWRTARVGDSYFANQKVRRGEFHSGSREVLYCRPPDRILDFCREIADKGPFLSVNIDVLETEDGELLANEFHAVWGSKQPDLTIVDGEPGRFRYEERTRRWKFEPGKYCRHTLCNLRVRTVLELLGKPLDKPFPSAANVGSGEPG
ncbi:MAG: hypothetical protein PVJ27_02440 [Candidatus Brocadiaceae bacterium]